MPPAVLAFAAGPTAQVGSPRTTQTFRLARRIGYSSRPHAAPRSNPFSLGSSRLLGRLPAQRGSFFGISSSATDADDDYADALL